MVKFFTVTQEEKVTAIVICIDPNTRHTSGKKYKKVDNTPRGISTFLQTMKRKFPSAQHCNFYARGFLVGRIEMQ